MVTMVHFVTFFTTIFKILINKFKRKGGRERKEGKETQFASKANLKTRGGEGAVVGWRQDAMRQG